MTNGRSIFNRVRTALLLGALALILATVGDTQVSSGGRGIDPLEVLNLSIKPNVIMVLDSSGSMQETVGGTDVNSGDHPRSKMFQAKQVLNTVVQDNANSVTFLFGQYTQNVFNPPAGSTTGDRLQNRSAGSDRFQYTTNNFLSPSMATTELTLEREPPPATKVLITTANDQIQFLERVQTAAATRTYVTCSVTLPTGSYIGDAALTGLAATINGLLQLSSYSAGCVKTGPSGNNAQNSYNVTWDVTNQRFVVTPVYGARADRFQMRFSSAANTAGPTLGFAVNVPNPTSGPPATTAATFADTNWSNAAVINGAALGATSAIASRGFQAFQDIRAAWSTFYYREGTTNCTVAITPGFYNTGELLATEITNKMNACPGRGATPNTYTVTFNVGNGSFTFDRTANTIAWTLVWSNGVTLANNSIAAALNAVGPVGITRSGTTATVTTSSAHGLPNGAKVTIAGADQGGYNGTFTIAVTSTTTFTYTPNGTPNSPATGNITAAFIDRTPGTGTYTTGNSIRLLRRSGSDEVIENFDYDKDGSIDSVSTYKLIAGRFFNGETFLVKSDGTLCGMDSAVSPANPPVVKLQQVSACGGSTVGSPVVFTFSGGSFGGNSISCNGFDAKVPLVPCDQTQGQLALMTPFLQRELPFNTDGSLKDYQEVANGAYALDTATGAPIPGPSGGIKADGSTPIAASLADIQTIFGTSSATGLWGAGQTTPAVTAIRTHTDPKERTIVIFVTDGDDTCALDEADTGTSDNKALTAAYRAELLFAPIDTAQAASSVTTYIVGFGSGASTDRLNWIAWGGSGLGQGATGQPNVATTTDTGTCAGTPKGGCVRWNETATQLQTKRNACTTCVDAFIAPDAETLADTLQSIIQQGASAGEFTAQESVTENVFEMTAEIESPPASGTHPFRPNIPNTRFGGDVPVMFRSSFTLPGFNGQVRAITRETSGAFTRWNAGQSLLDLVRNGPGNTNTGTLTCGDDGVPNSGLCLFSTLPAKIKRNIFTTSRNGVFPVTVANYFDITWLRTNGNRTLLWPPPANVNPAVGTVGILDAALDLTGLTFADLQAEFGACAGTNAPTVCASGTPTQQLDLALKESREMLLGYMAGAAAALDANGAPLRVAAGANAGQILYRARSWVLGDSTLAQAAVISVPIENPPDASPWGAEYKLMRDGFRTGTGNAVAGIDFGLGLRTPDKDTVNAGAAADTRADIKPVMTMLYVPANDMLHAFRAGPTASTTAAPPNCTVSTTVDCGGEELWGFVPFDQLDKLRLRLRPQTRLNHVYMMGPVRFTDVFVPNAGTTGNYDGSSVNRTVGGVANSMKGVWRRMIFFGRGAGGKYVTALDVTAPGPYTRTSKDSANPVIGPIVLWNRGNPDTQDGTPTGTVNNSVADQAAYSHMGETWSTPAIVTVSKLPTTRKPCAGTSTAGQVCADQSGGGVTFVAFMGSGYGDAGEGTTFYTLDALTGDVVAAADVGSRTPLPAGGYPNALVAPASAFNQEEFVLAAANHPANARATRVYIGDVHGRLWKFLTTAPGLPILFADLGANQPIATGAALSFLPQPVSTSTKPHIYVTTGNDSRADAIATGSFRIYGFRDDQADGDTASPPTTTFTTCAVNNPQPPCLFVRDFELQFRGTVQPATAFTDTNLGRVFFGGTRFVPPPPQSAISTPVPPFPCRSRFDSIVYPLGAQSGLAAYDLNGSGDDSFLILDNSRLAGINIGRPPYDPSNPNQKAEIHLDEGLAGSETSANDKPPMKGASAAAAASTTMTLFRQNSTVCRTQ